MEPSYLAFSKFAVNSLLSLIVCECGCGVVVRWPGGSVPAGQYCRQTGLGLAHAWGMACMVGCVWMVAGPIVCACSCHS